MMNFEDMSELARVEIDKVLEAGIAEVDLGYPSPFDRYNRNSWNG